MSYTNNFKPQELNPQEIENFDSPLDDLDALDEQVAAPPDPEEMLPLLTAADHQARMLATRAFCELKEPRAIPYLINLLNDRCPMIRMSAAYALGRNPSPEAVSPLIQQLDQDWNGYVRKGAVCALGNCGDRRAIPPLIEALTTEIPAVRLWAASALGQLKSIGPTPLTPAIEPLIQSLRQDPIDGVRGNCAWALGQICQELPFNETYNQVIDTLLEILVSDPDMGVREDAKEALLKVGDPRALQRIEELEQEGEFW